MKRFTSAIASLAVLAAASHAEIKWGKNLDMAKKQAKASKRLIFVDFYADW